MIETLCLPVIINSLIIFAHFTVNLINSKYKHGFMKLISGIIYTLFLFLLCKYNYNKVAWFFLIIPILFTLVYTILLVTIFKKVDEKLDQIDSENLNQIDS